MISLQLALAGLEIALLVVVILLLRKRQGIDLSDLKNHLGPIDDQLGQVERGLRDEISRLRTESGQSARSTRDELQGNWHSFRQEFISQMGQLGKSQKDQLELLFQQLSTLTQSNELKLDKMRETVQTRLEYLQEENSKKLEQIRASVDEQLHATLEKRLGESFKLVSERLEAVHQGLGDMQNLAIGVGDLKKVLTNVKSRGIWGEYQLGNIIEDILTPDQYDINVVTKKGSKERVEYAVKLPGRGDSPAGVIFLPIDSKFPQEDYHRLMEAHEKGDKVAGDEAHKQLANRVKAQAKDIRDKYLDPPYTTDFGLMFLPTESLFAEVLRIPGLFNDLQREYRVAVAGPTTLASLLNTLSMGFKTLAIEKRSSEVWVLLGAVKTAFNDFGEILDKTHKKLEEATNHLESANRRTRSIKKKLKEVEELPLNEARQMIGHSEDTEEEDNEGP